MESAPGDDDEEGWDDDDDDEEEDAEDLRQLGLGQVGRADDLDALRQHLQDLGGWMGHNSMGNNLVLENQLFCAHVDKTQKNRSQAKIKARMCSI